MKRSILLWLPILALAGCGELWSRVVYQDLLT